jgi:hypothetical protein
MQDDIPPELQKSKSVSDTDDEFWQQETKAKD